MLWDSLFDNVELEKIEDRKEPDAYVDNKNVWS